MMRIRGSLAALGVAVALACAALSACSSGAGSTEGLTTVTIGTPNAGFSPQGINYLIADRLGYYKAQGLSVKIVNLGSVQSMQSALATGKIDFATYADTFLAAVLVKKQPLRGTAFYEFTYPFKYGIAVSPDSPVTSMSQLSGKKVGTVSFNQSDYGVGQKLLGDAGARDIAWLATGIGAQSGEALRQGKIDALAYSDTGFGQILGAGIPLRFLPVPPDRPFVGGQTMVANDDIWAHHRKLAAGLARAMSQASVYTLANPTAAAYQYLKTYPTTAPAGKSLADQLATIETSVVLRSRVFVNGSDPLGTVSKENLDAAVRFAGGDPATTDTGPSFSNELVAFANQFDAGAVQAAAKQLPIPGLDGPVPLPTFPPGTP